MKKIKKFLLSILLIVVIFCEMFLFISYKKPDVKSIAYQHTDSNFAENIEKIEYTNNTQRKGLTTLYLEINKSNANEVNKYSKVEHLSIDGTDIKTMPDLTGLQAYGISVKNVKSFDLEQLDLSRISSITLNKTNLSDVSAVGKMKNLKSLTINESEINNVDFLKSIPNLTVLAIWNCNVKDFSSIGNLKLLENLTIVNCGLSDVSFLENCSSITWLDLHKNVISDISPIKNLEELRTLDLSRNKIQGATDLSKLNGLVHLDLSHNEITDVTVSLNELYSANLSYNKIKALNDKMLNAFKKLPSESMLSNVNVFGNIIDTSQQLKNYDFINYTDEKNVSFSYEEYEKYINQIKYIKDTCINDKWNDLQKSVAVYDYFVSNIKFDYNTPDDEPYPYNGILHTEYGALVNKKAVCDGFSYAYRDILNYLNIECMVYHGDINSVSDNSAHVWNIIKIDGEYYHCDITWRNFGLSDDTMKSKSYFLLDKTAPKCKKDMNQEHINEITENIRSFANAEVNENE